MSRIIACGLFFSVLLVGSAAASPVVGVTRLDGYCMGYGGEFTVTANAELAALTGETKPFGSFCMEWSEYVTMDRLYDVTVNQEALLGGVNYGPVGPGGGDPVDPRTAYLYTQFRAGTLAGYDYTPGATGRAVSAQALQEVFWYLEDERPMTWEAGSLQDAFYTAAQNAVDSGQWTGLGNVRIMNIYALGHPGDLDYRAQDMLILVTVPAPGAILLAGIGSCLVAWRRRHKML